MNQATVTISLNYTVPPQDASALLQKLLAALPAAAITTVGSVPANGQHAATRSWPAIPSTAEDAYIHLAKDNLRRLVEGDIPDNGWGGVKDLPRAIASLRAQTRKVVLRAIENGGHITRDEVYELIGRDKEQSLNGFTKPSASLSKKLMDSGELPAHAQPLLKPIYKKSKDLQKTQGFAVPVQVVSLMTR